MIEIVIISFLILSVLVFCALLFVDDKKFIQHENGVFPAISILIAVRNEEKNLPELFQALQELEYPEDKLEIIFGNDQSEDDSKRLIIEFCENHFNAKVYDIQDSEIQIAKANVLMQIAQKSKGEYLYFVDADMRPNPGILKAYISYFDDPKAGITGVSIPRSSTLFEKIQSIDWVFALSLVAKAEKLGQDTTAMGNNMMIRNSDYKAVGGYESLPKSVVEDYTLYKSIRDRNRAFPLVFEPSLLSFTEAMPDLFSLLNQRKRWMTGGVQVNWLLKSILVLQGVYYPLIIVSVFFFSYPIFILIVLKFVLQSIFIQLRFLKLKLKVSFFQIFLYEIYNTIFTSLLLVFYLLPFKIEWKKRKYGHH